MESGTQMTFAELGLMMSLPQNVIVSDFLANLSAYLDTDEVLKTQGALCSLRLCELLKKDSLNTYSLKMSQGCLTIVGGGTFTTIITTMAQLGYSVEWQVLNSRHFGVPQHRQRVFIVGHLGNGSFAKVFPFTECCGTPNEVPTTGIGGVNVATSQFKRPKPTNISAPLCARDYKGVRHNDYGTVVMYGNSKGK